jgi:serine/threonine protein kinase
MNTAVKDFLKQVIDLKIIDRDDLKNFLGEWSHQQPKQDARFIARALVDRQFLTEYQATVILRGKGHLLCMKNYLIREKIEKGGMGTVFLAEHRTMRRNVAMKVLSKKNTHDSRAIRRFFLEAQTAARLCHPNITAAFDADRDHGHWFLVSEYVDGEDFQKLVEQNGTLFPRVAIDLLLQAAKGLEFAHESGVTHRDIKPSNLMLNREGKVKLLDLGLARLEADADNTRLTCADVVMGTPHYMAPEQADQIDGADARSDIYSLGCTLFFLLTGEPPYNEKTVVRALIAHRDRAIPDLQNFRDDISPDLQIVLERMMAKDPNVRYQKMSEVIEDFESMKTGERPRRALDGKHPSSHSGLQPSIDGLNQENADESAEYYLDDGESQASVPTWQIVSEKGTTSVDCISGDPRTELSDSETPAGSRGAIERIASGVTSMLSFLKLPG